MNILLWMSFIAAIVMSVIVWVGNLKIASDVKQPVDGIVWVYVSWGVFFMLILLKLMTIGVR